MQVLVLIALTCSLFSVLSMSMPVKFYCDEVVEASEMHVKTRERDKILQGVSGNSS